MYHQFNVWNNDPKSSVVIVFVGWFTSSSDPNAYSYGHLSVISTYNPIYRMYNPIYNQL